MTTTTTIPSDTLRHAADAAANHAHEVGDALRDVLTAQTPAGLSFASDRLRMALVTLAARFECGAHDGATFARRVDAAKAALAAWGAV